MDLNNETECAQCGHTYGDHAVSAPHRCLHGGRTCRCEAFFALHKAPLVDIAEAIAQAHKPLPSLAEFLRFTHGQCPKCIAGAAFEDGRCVSCKAEVYRHDTSPDGIREAAELKATDDILSAVRRGGDWAKVGIDVGALVAEKKAAYGDSFTRSGRVLRELYPNGISVDQLDDALTIVRILDKLFRIAADRDAFGEDPFRDIVGYGLLSIVKRAGEKGGAK